MENANFELLDKPEFEQLKHCFQSNETFEEDSSKLMLRSERVYASFLKYFEDVHKLNLQRWYTDKFEFNNNSDKAVGTDILLNKLLDGFEFFLGYDNTDGILLFASKFGVLALVGIREDIKSKVDKYIDEKNNIFVCVITLRIVDEEKIFANNFDEIIFHKVETNDKRRR